MGTVILLHKRPHVDLPEAARLKGVSRQAVWGACREGRLKARRLGRFWLVPLADLRKWRPDRPKALAAKGA